MKKHFFAVFLLVFFSFNAGAIVVVPPVIYFVTLSIATFLANALIGLLAIVAVSGIANKKFFGKKLSELVYYFFGWIKKILIAVFSMLAAVFLIKPIEIISIIQGSIAALVTCLVLFFISNYSVFRIVSKQEKTRLLRSAVFFSLVISLLFGFAAFTSIETQIIATKGLGNFYPENKSIGSDFGLNIPFDDALPKANAPVSTQQPYISEGVQDTQGEPVQDKTFLGLNLWFYPLTNNECNVTIGSQYFSYAPSESCYFLDNGVPVRIFCPVQVFHSQITQRGPADLTASGSCQAIQKINVLDNGFEVDGK